MSTPRRVFVTHKKPHLDEVTAAWLMQTFDPAMKNCEFLFIANSPTGGDVPAGDQYVPVGVGRGKFDEHGMRAGHSACQLVYQDLLHRALIPNDEVDKKAVEMIVDYTHRQDTAQWSQADEINANFSLPAMLRGVAILHSKDPSPVMMNQGLSLVAALHANLREYAQFLADWNRRIEFDTPWGRGVGIQSVFRGSDLFAYHHGYKLRVQTDPTKPFGDFRGPANSPVDLTPIYKKLQAVEPEAWFLHQSHKILVSNSDSAQGNQRPVTKLNLQQLIDFVRK